MCDGALCKPRQALPLLGGHVLRSLKASGPVEAVQDRHDNDRPKPGSTDRVVS